MIVGIDLGTSNSLIGYWDGQHAQLIKNVHGSVLTPSAVALEEDGSLVVGAVAAAKRYVAPSTTAVEFKRLMGSAQTVQLGTKTFSAVELSALVLKSLKADAERELEQPITQAVISVPAYFNDHQREATMQAGRLAGLTVQQIISEPTAAALAYGLHNHASEQFLVLDLGGGTFDVSLVDMFEGVVQVKAIAGDNYLGGSDFTAALVADFAQTQGLAPVDLTPAETARLTQQFETAKRQLTQEESVAVTVPFRGESRAVTLTRPQFATLVAPLLERLRAPILRVLNDADQTVADIDHVLLVGGATKMPVVREFVARLFRRLPDTQLAPDEVVGRGVSVATQLETDERLREALIMTDVAAYTLGTDIASEAANGEWRDDVYLPIIERNTPIPVSIVKSFSTIQATGKIVVRVYQGEHPQASANLLLGELTLKTKAERDHEFTVRFSYDVNGVLVVDAVDEENGTTSQLVLQNNGQLAEADIAASLERLAAFKVLPKDRAENRLLLAQLERLFAETHGREREMVQTAITDFEGVLADQQPQEIAAMRQRVTEFLAAMQGRRPEL